MSNKIPTINNRKIGWAFTKHNEQKRHLFILLPLSNIFPLRFCLLQGRIIPESGKLLPATLLLQATILNRLCKLNQRRNVVTYRTEGHYRQLLTE